LGRLHPHIAVTVETAAPDAGEQSDSAVLAEGDTMKSVLTLAIATLW
jgi:hypothetical protein